MLLWAFGLDDGPGERARGAGRDWAGAADAGEKAGHGVVRQGRALGAILCDY